MAPKDEHVDTEIALIKHDLVAIRENLTDLKVDFYDEIKDIKEDVKTIKSYFLRAIFAAIGIVGIQFMQWMLNGGLSGATAQ